MLELVIEDDLHPPLECPGCHGIYVHCSLDVVGGELVCKYCGDAFLAARASTCITPPAGLSISSGVAGWSIDISTRSIRAALGFSAAGFVVPGAIWKLDHLWSTLSPHSGQALVVGAVGAAVTLFGAAAYWGWGRYSVSVENSVGTVFRGIGPFGKSQTFFLSVLNGVRLVRSVEDDEKQARHVIRLEGLDFHLDFGADLTEQQRTYIALFLLQRAAL